MQSLDQRTLGTLPVAVGEKVAFLEDHPDQPGKYGLIAAVGYDPNRGSVALDVHVFDPFDGVVDYDAPTLRIGLEEIQ